MLLRINKRNRRCKRAFTLVEIIVVLVILAVLAAMIVPALTGYIKRARRTAYIQKADEARIAAQAVMEEFYGIYDMDIEGCLDTAVNSTTNVNWYSGKGAVFGDRVLELMGLGRGAENGEPYILVIGVGHDEDTNLDATQRARVYYVGYIEDIGSPSLFYVNGEWTYRWPRDNNALMSGDRLIRVNKNDYHRNTLRMADGTEVCIRFYVICNRSAPGNNRDSIWLASEWKPNHPTLEGNAEGHNGF